MEIKFSEGDRSVYQFLHSVLAQPFPDPVRLSSALSPFAFSYFVRFKGATVVAKTISFTKNEKGEEDFKPEVYRLTRSDNDYEYLEFVSYSPLFEKMDLDKILQIFECLLYERRIIICSKTLSTLSACVDAISNLAYPLAWQYVLIPILPKSMLSFLGAPMPFLIGILSSYIPLIEKEPIEEEVLIIDIDENKFIRTPSTTDEIPPSLRSSLLKTLKKITRSGTSSFWLAQSSRTESQLFLAEGMEFSLLVAHAFLRFFSAIFEDYNRYLSATEQFQFDRFSRHKSSEIRRFLNEFQNVQMYSSFIQEREMMHRKGILDQCILQRISKTELKKKIETNVAKHKSGQTAPVNPAATTPAVHGDSIGLQKTPSWSAVTGPSLTKMEELRKSKPVERPVTIEGSASPVNAAKVETVPAGAAEAPEPSTQPKAKPPVPVRTGLLKTKPRADTLALAGPKDDSVTSSESRGAFSGVTKWFTMRGSKEKAQIPAEPVPVSAPVPVPASKPVETADLERPKSPLSNTKRARRRSSSADLEPSRSGSPRPVKDAVFQDDVTFVPSSAESSPGPLRRELAGSGTPLRESRLQRAAESLLHIDGLSNSSGDPETDRRSRRLGRILQGLPSDAIFAVGESHSDLDIAPRPGRLEDDLAILVDNSEISDSMLVTSSREGKCSPQAFYAYKPLLLARVPELLPYFTKAEEEAKQNPSVAPQSKLAANIARVAVPFSANVLMCILQFAYADRLSFDQMQPEEDIELLQIRSKSLRRLKSACLKYAKQRRLVRGTLGLCIRSSSFVCDTPVSLIRPP